MRRVVVLGGGESGVGVARLAQTHGEDVFLSDSGTIKDKYKHALDAAGIAYEEHQHTMERLLTADVVVKSPGIPDSAPVLQSLIHHGIPIVSEIEFCYPYLRGRTIGITGSNGKTTTTMLIYHVLRTAGLDVALGGNIGRSLAQQVVDGTHHWYVIELSSFQLDNCYEFTTDIAVLLNITPDHLDRYGYDFQRYADSKMRIIQNQTRSESLVYWSEDDVICRELQRRQQGETIAGPTPSSLPARSGKPTLCPFCDADYEAYHLSSTLLGQHNKRNVLAAYLAARAVGIADDVVRRAISTFHAVEHRLQYVATKGGVDYINDSKATNVDACKVALEAMTKPTVLIIGGTDKGNDYSVILPLVIAKCRGIVFLGKDNAKLHSVFDPIGIPISDTHAMSSCVAACQTMAHEGEVVLLSPCCASFDLFRNMEDRGQQFIDNVNNI